MKRRLLACLLVLVLAGPVSAQPAGAPPAARGSWSVAWGRLVDFFRGFHLVRIRNASGHDLPPPCTTLGSNG